MKKPDLRACALDLCQYQEKAGKVGQRQVCGQSPGQARAPEFAPPEGGSLHSLSTGFPRLALHQALRMWRKPRSPVGLLPVQQGVGAIHLPKYDKGQQVCLPPWFCCFPLQTSWQVPGKSRVANTNADRVSMECRQFGVCDLGQVL